MHTESSDLLSILDELYPNALSNGRVGLFGLDTNFLEDDTLGVRRATKGRGLEGGSEKPLLEGLISPATASTLVCSSEIRLPGRDQGNSYLSRRCVRSLRAALRPLGLPLDKTKTVSKLDKRHRSSPPLNSLSHLDLFDNCCWVDDCR